MARLLRTAAANAVLVLLVLLAARLDTSSAQNYVYDEEDRVIFSFDCKMNVVWRQRYKKYAFYAPDVAVQTDCTFEDFMWHHVVVTVDDDGVGKLFVDGEAQHLEDVDGQPLGTSFSTCMYPNLDIPASLDTPGECSAVSVDTSQYMCQFQIGKLCPESTSPLGGQLNGFDGLVDEVVVYDRDVSLGDNEVPDIMFKMPLYIQPRELNAPSGVQKDLRKGLVMYTKFNKVPCSVPDITVANETTAYDEAGLQAYIPISAGVYQADGFNDTVKINSLGMQSLVYTGVPFKPPEITTVSAGGVENKLPLGGTVIINGAGFAKSPFSTCALIQPQPGIDEAEEGKWEPLYGPGPSPIIYDNFYVKSDDPTYSREGLTVYSYSSDGYMKLETKKDTVSITGARAIEYSDLLTKQSNIPPYYIGLGFQRTPYVPVNGEPGPRLAYSMYEQVECEVPRAAFPSDRYTLVVSNDGGLTGSSSNFIEVSEMSLKFDGQTNLTLARPWSTWKPFAISMWIKPSIGTQVDATIIDFSDASTTMRLSYSMIGSSDGSIIFTNGDEVGSKAMSNPVDLNSMPTEMWHHVIVLVETRISGTQVTAYVDGEVIYGPKTAALSTPIASIVGRDFYGNLDEIKVFKDPPQPTRVLDRAFRREPDGAPLLWDYYRLNSNFENSAPDGLGYSALCSGTCMFEASQAPWEPSIIYEVNGKPANEMSWSSVKGGEDITVTGYNLAPSEFLTCMWGESTPVEGYEINEIFTGGIQSELCNDGVPQDLNALPPPAAPIAGPITNFPPAPIGVPIDVGGRRRSLLQDDGEFGIIKQESLGRPDGHAFRVTPQPVFLIDDINQTALTAMPQSGLATVSCKSPVMAESTLTQFAVANERTLTPVEWEVSEVGAECDGIDDYITFNQVAAAMGSRSYAFGLWIFPYAEPRPHAKLAVEGETFFVDDPTEATVIGDGGRRRLQMVHEGEEEDHERHETFPPSSPETTILAFETLDGPSAERDKAMLMYNGERFFYYDSRIQDAFSTGVGSKPGEWHYVFVQVDEEGNGELHVDCELAQTFTTTSRPDAGPSGILTMCADVDADGLVSSFFPGIVDELVVFDTSFASTSVDYEQQTCRQTKFDQENFFQGLDKDHLVAYFDFTRYDRKQCRYTPEPTTPAPTPAPSTPAPLPNDNGRRRLLSEELVGEDEPTRRAAFGLIQGDLIPSHKYNIDFAKLECGDIIMPDMSPYERHGRVSALNVAPLPLRESAPWVKAQAIKASVTSSNIAGGINVTFSGANFAPSKFLSLKLGNAQGLIAESIPVVHKDDVRPEDTLSILKSVVAQIPKGQCGVNMDIAEISNLGTELGTSRLGLQFRPDMEDLLATVAVHNDFNGQRDGRNSVRRKATALLGQAVSPDGLKPADLEEFTTCLWLRLAYPEDPYASLPSKHIGGWKFVCTDSNGAMWMNAARLTEADELEFWGGLMESYVATGELFPASSGYSHTSTTVGSLKATNRHLVDAAWIWPRVLQDCELLSRYYTNEEYALDMTKGHDQVTISRSLTLSDFHFDAWVYPYDVPGQQMILATTDGTWGIGLEGTSVMVYIYKKPCVCKRCSLDVGQGTCDKACTEWFQMSSHRAQVRPDRWSFISVGYKATQGGPAEMHIAIDGVLSATYMWDASSAPQTSTASGTYEMVVGDDPQGRAGRFQGLIAQVGLGSYTYWSDTAPISSLQETFYQQIPYSSKLNAQCPGGGPDVQRRSTDHISVFGDSLGMDLMVPGVAKLLSNISYDSETTWEDTTAFGLPRSGNTGFLKSDELAHFTATMRNQCRNKRPVGGALLSAKVALDSAPTTELAIPLTDTLDGNYHGSINATDVVKAFGSCNSNFKVVMSWDTDGSALTDSLEMDLALDIRPAATSPATTSISNPADDPNQALGSEQFNGNGCFGAVNRWVIQARDAQGCKKLPLAAGESPEDFKVTLTGPATIEANVTYTENSAGEYNVYWFAPVAGTYQLHASIMDPVSGEYVAIAGSGRCVEVCAGYSLLFDGNSDNEGWLEVTAIKEGVSQGLTSLELAEPEGFTMEVWFSISGDARSGVPGPSLNADAPYLLLKNAQEAGIRRDALQIKGYSLGFDPAYENLTATAYCGLGRYRQVTADLTTYESDAWIHVAAVYNTTHFTMYLNGEPVSEEVFEESLPAHPDVYNHPLTIGMGFRGMMDELKLWKRPRTHDEVASTMFCPPYLEMSDVAGYWSFNHRTDENLGKFLGSSADCLPMQDGSVNTAATWGPTCLVAHSPFPQSFFIFKPKPELDTPMKLSAYGSGMGAPSARHSTLSGPGLTSAPAFDSEGSLLTVHARDQCGFAYNRGFPRSPLASDPTMEDPATPRISELFTSTIQSISTKYFSADPPLEELPDGYPVIVEGEREQVVLASYEPGPCMDSGSSAETTSDGTTFNLPIYATKTGNSYLDISVMGAQLTAHRDVISASPAFDQTTYAPYVLLITSGRPTTIKLEETPLRGVYAGVPAGMHVMLEDAGENLVETEYPLVCKITALGTAGVEYPAEVTFMGDGKYLVVFTAPAAGDYKMSLDLDLVDDDGNVISTLSTSFDFEAQAVSPRRVITSATPPEGSKRFEHSAVVHDDKLWVWGGASSSNGAHRSDMWSLPLAATEPGRGSLAWRKSVKVTTAEPVEGEVTLKVFVDTLELYNSGRVQPTCADIAFVAPPSPNMEETVLSYHMDRQPGCQSVESVFWVKLPAGLLQAGEELEIFMYYGNPIPHEVSGYEDSAGALLFYEGFESGVVGGIDGTILSASSPCGASTADKGGFEVTSELAFSGHQSLKAAFGADGAVEALAGQTVDAFTLRAAFYDNDALDSSHFVSPNYDRCRQTPGGKPLAPNPDADPEFDAVSTAVGTYTLAHPSRLCVSTPWESVETTRSAKWHMLEITSTPETGLKLSVDGEVRKETSTPVTLDRVFLSAGFGIADMEFEGLPTSMAMWDEIVVAVLSPSVTVTSVTAAAYDETVAWVAGRKWQLESEGPLADDGASPTPRQGQCSVMGDGVLYVFGGERAGYAFSDLWKFDFGTGQWEMLSDGEIPARHDAACFLVPGTDTLVVHGGKSGRSILGDIMGFELTTGEWVELEVDSEISARFGHSAVFVDDSIFIFGGVQDSGPTTELYKCTLSLAGSSPSGSCSALRAAPTEVPSFAHVAFADTTFMYVHGGTDLELRSAGTGSTWRYSISNNSWQEVPIVQGSGLESLQHSGQVAAPLHFADDSRLGGAVLHGGSGADGGSDVYFVSL